MGDAHRRPALEDLLAVRIRGGRHDRDARSRAARRREQLGVESGHRGEELAGAYERHRAGHGGESRGARGDRVAGLRTRCDTGRR